MSDDLVTRLQKMVGGASPDETIWILLKLSGLE
jgi:hypothetical protein